MRKALLVLALGLAAPFSAAAESTFQTSLQERYCGKLRESALAYVLFVRRLAPIHGYTYTDFAPAYPGAPVKADCRVEAARVAAVHALLASSR
jgi:hypothetical protein